MSKGALQRALYRTLMRKARALETTELQNDAATGRCSLWLQDSVSADVQSKPLNFNLQLSSVLLRARILQRIFPAELAPFVDKIPDRSLNSGTLKNMITSSFRDNSLSVDCGFSAIRALNEQLHIRKVSSIATVKDVRVTIQTMPDGDGDDIESRFTYRITVENMGDTSIRIIGRHWEFSNKVNGVISTVPKWSPGVIGLKPIIKPGEAFLYASSARIMDSMGWMDGALLIENYDTKELADIPIARCHFIR